MTFSYESSARRGIPVDPTIYRIRNDLSWDDVVRSSHNEKAYLNGMKKTKGGKRSIGEERTVTLEKKEKKR